MGLWVWVFTPRRERAGNERRNRKQPPKSIVCHPPSFQFSFSFPSFFHFVPIFQFRLIQVFHQFPFPRQSGGSYSPALPVSPQPFQFSFFSIIFISSQSSSYASFYLSSIPLSQSVEEQLHSRPSRLQFFQSSFFVSVSVSFQFSS